jgi:hypothetical protein
MLIWSAEANAVVAEPADVAQLGCVLAIADEHVERAEGDRT